MSGSESTPVPLDTALRVARSLLDGATDAWVADRFELTASEVEWSREYAESAIKEYYRNRDVPISDFKAFCEENIESVIALLVDWTEMLSRPVVPIPQSDPDNEDESGKKNGTSQGETGDTPGSP